MILFALRCGNDHTFDAWFRDGAAFDALAAAGSVSCPTCGDTRVVKAPMAPRLARHHAARDATPAPRPAGDAATGDRTADPETAGDGTSPAEIRAALLALKRKIQAACDYVGDRFPEEARRIHYGEADPRPIYGEASPEQARDLAEEGVAIAAVPWVNEGN